MDEISQVQLVMHNPHTAPTKTKAHTKVWTTTEGIDTLKQVCYNTRT